ncbi:hypothetical protein AB4Y63_17715 [Leifsonia sp. YAF41]|uniref:hypothetical protein n=1 Tax=Leifsonia sp. YAF41 TaxID=3233086 RepID=UPI003F9A88C9
MKRSKLFVFSAVLAITIGGAFVAPASADEAGSPIALVLENTKSFVDKLGQPIEIIKDSDEIGQRVVVGRNTAGEPVLIRIFSAPPTGEAVIPDPEIAAEDALQNSTAMNPGKVEETVTSETNPVVPKELFKPTFAVAVTPTSVSLAWANDNLSGYTVSEGTRERTVNDREFTDAALTPGTEYTYNIDPVATDGDSSSFTLSVATPRAVDENSRQDALSAANDALTLSAAVSGVVFEYDTFIPVAMVSGNDVFACTLQTGMQFGGDGRGYVPPGDDDYRTSVYVNAGFTSASLSTTKYVGTTHLYKNGVLYQQMTAPSTGITFSDKQISSTYAQARITHSVGNPFCNAGAISYGVLVRSYSSGLVEVIGTRLPAPNHAGWVLFKYTWESLFKYDNEGFICLTGVCGERSTNASKYSS